MDFLKKLTAPGFQVTGYGQGIVNFKCSKNLKQGATVDGVASLPGGVRCDLTVTIDFAAQGSYTAKVSGPAASLTLLEKVFLPRGDSLKAQMYYKPNEDDMTRHARTYAVRCRDFHNFKGTTAELSRAGALVMLTGPIDQDKEISLQIDLDDTDLQPMGVEATVDWCTRRDEKTWIASLTFKPLSQENDTILNAFLAELKFRVPGTRPQE
jgi:hypothetical protein